MPKIIVQNLDNKVVHHPVVDNSKSVLNILHEHGIDWMHACGAKGRCTTCKALVTSGMDQLSDLSEAEEKYRKQQKLADNERLTCQCRLRGEITIRVPDANKMPHVKYSD